MLVALLCGAISVALGSVYLVAAGAPPRFVLVNLGALAIGTVIAAALRRLPATWRAASWPLTLAIGLSLLATAVFGQRFDGASRWIAVGGFTLQPSLVLAPLAMVSFARRPDWIAAVGLGIAGLALGAQPDRGMAGALAAGLAVLWLVRREWPVAAAFGAALAGLAFAGLRPDTVPPAPFVERVVASAFATGALAGGAVVAGLAAMLVPAAVGLRLTGIDRDTGIVFGATWFAVIVASLLGDYPTPLVGYGSSAILGYCLSASALR